MMNQIQVNKLTHHIAKEGGALKALSLDYSATGNKATFDIDTNGFLEIHPDGLSTHFSGSITASGEISGSRFIGDARGLFNVPQDLAWDGALGDGFLQIITNNSYAGSVTNNSLILTSSIIYNGMGDVSTPLNNAIIYKSKPSNSIPATNFLAIGVGAIIFSGSTSTIDATTQLLINAGSVKVINLGTLNPTADGKIYDTSLLGAINNLLQENSNNTGFNDGTLSYNLQDSYLLLSNAALPQQIGLSYLQQSDPSQTKVWDFRAFQSHSQHNGVTIFKDIAENPNKVYTSLNTDLDTTFNSNVSSSGTGSFAQISLPDLPTSDPGIAGRLFTTQSTGTGGNLDGQKILLVSAG